MHELLVELKTRHYIARLINREYFLHCVGALVVGFAEPCPIIKHFEVEFLNTRQHEHIYRRLTDFIFIVAKDLFEVSANLLDDDLITYGAGMDAAGVGVEDEAWVIQLIEL